MFIFINIKRQTCLDGSMNSKVWCYMIFKYNCSKQVDLSFNFLKYIKFDLTFFLHFRLA